MNRNIQRILAAAAGLCLVTGLSYSAQAAGRGESRKSAPVERAERFREHIKKVADILALTDAQRADLHRIFQNEREALIELRDDDSLTRREKIAALREIRARVIEAIQGILTPEQRELWKQLREDQRNALREELAD